MTKEFHVNINIAPLPYQNEKSIENIITFVLFRNILMKIFKLAKLPVVADVFSVFIVCISNIFLTGLLVKIHTKTLMLLLL